MWIWVALGLLLVGAWRVITARETVRQLIALNVMAAGGTLLLVAVGHHELADARASRTMAAVAVVVAFAVTAFGAWLARRLRQSDPAAAAPPADHDPGAGG